MLNVHTANAIIIKIDIADNIFFIVFTPCVATPDVPGVAMTFLLAKNYRYVDGPAGASGKAAQCSLDGTFIVD